MTELTLFGGGAKPPKTSKPTKQDIEILLKEGGKEKVEAAEVLGGLAVHRNGKNDGWRLTHVPTGMLLKIYRLKKSAQAARAELLKEEIEYSFEERPPLEVSRKMIEAMMRAPRD